MTSLYKTLGLNYLPAFLLKATKEPKGRDVVLLPWDSRLGYVGGVEVTDESEQQSGSGGIMSIRSLLTLSRVPGLL